MAENKKDSEDIDDELLDDELLDDDDDEEDDMTGFEVENDPSLTYAMQIGTIEKDSRIFLGKADGEDANRQAILKILNTERYENVIYSWNYGVYRR